MKFVERAKEIGGPSLGCTIGATLGLLSLFIPWVGRTPNYLVGPPPTTIDPRMGLVWKIHLPGGFPYATQYGIFDLMELNSAIKLAILVFIAGSLLSLVTRLGGLLQAFGLIGFGVEFSERLMEFRAQSNVLNTTQFEFYLSLGCVLAMVSTFLVLFSGKRALENPACGCVPCNVRVGALAPRATRIRT